MENSAVFEEPLECVGPGLYMVRLRGEWPDEDRIERYCQQRLNTDDSFELYNRVEGPELGPGSRFIVIRRD